MAELRRPGQVPAELRKLRDPPIAVPDTGIDTDGDGHADTVVTDDGFDLVLATDLDGDGLADQVLRVGPDGVVREHVAPSPGHAVADALLDGADAGTDHH